MKYVVMSAGNLTAHYAGDDKDAARAAVQANAGSKGYHTSDAPGLNKPPKAKKKKGGEEPPKVNVPPAQV